MKDLLEALRELLPDADYNERSAVAGAISDLRDRSAIRPLVRWDNDDELRGECPWDEFGELPSPGEAFGRGDLERLIERSRSDRHASIAVFALFCDYAATGQYVPLPITEEVGRRLGAILAGEKPNKALGLRRQSLGRPRAKRDAPPPTHKLLLALAAEQAMAEGLTETEAWQLIRKCCCLSSPNTAKAIVRLAKRKHFRDEFPAAGTIPGLAFPRLSVTSELSGLEGEPKVLALLVECHDYAPASASARGSFRVLLDALAYERYSAIDLLCEELGNRTGERIDPADFPRPLPEEYSMYADSDSGLKDLRRQSGWLRARLIARNLAD